MLYEQLYHEKGNLMNELGKSILIDRYARDGESTLEDVFRRVASEVAFNEQEEESFFRVMMDGRFIPGGRILAADDERTYFNCYVLPSPKDSREGIFDTALQMVEIMSRGGGVGINISSLRPRGALAKKVGGRSSGAVSWGGLYSYATGLVEQGGSRRGALLLCLNDWHPDLLEFIDSKRESGKITNANISVAISDSFMRAVNEGRDWHFVFPDTDFKNYDKWWDGNLDSWKGDNLPIKHYGSMPAREVWDKIMKSAWASAEPGVLFMDRANAMSTTNYFNTLVCTNPCGEQFLPPWGVCNLGHINLSKMYKQRGYKVEFDWGKLVNATEIAVRFLDNVIDVTPYYFKENEEVQKGERRIGLGTMGFAELLIRMGIRYGSDESVDLAWSIQSTIAERAYRASSDLALERGSFPKFNVGEFLKTGFALGSLGFETLDKIKIDGLRNSCLLTQAPTGTVGTMMNTSTGIEPFYSFKHYRKTRMGVFEESHPILSGVEKLEDYHVTAMDITPKEHVTVMAAFQNNTDNSISKTVNLPNDATIEDVKTVYDMLYKSGCKGGTVYRDGSRDEQVLHLATSCDECGGDNVITDGGCSTCQVCGWSMCAL